MLKKLIKIKLPRTFYISSRWKNFQRFSLTLNWINIRLSFRKNPKPFEPLQRTTPRPWNIKIPGCRGITAVRFISEEVFGSNKALWFSPSGNKLAFGYFDDSQTPIITIPFYGYPGSMSFQYTTAISIHYPKVSVQLEGGRERRRRIPLLHFVWSFAARFSSNHDSSPGFCVHSRNWILENWRREQVFDRYSLVTPRRFVHWIISIEFYYLYVRKSRVFPRGIF